MSDEFYAPVILSMKKIASTHRIESWEDPICSLGKVNFAKGTGLLQPGTEYGAQRACFKA